MILITIIILIFIHSIFFLNFNKIVKIFLYNPILELLSIIIKLEVIRVDKDKMGENKVLVC
jgi:hypothetical protein